MTTATRTGTVLTPCIAVADARNAIEWYQRVLDARLRADPYEMEDGRIGHAELDIGGARLMLADEFPEIGLRGPLERGGASVSLTIEVADVDGLLERARAAGAPQVWDAADQDYGRSGRFDDPFGHRWQVIAPVEVPAQQQPGAGHGDVEYLSIATPDTAAARRFYGGVLGWSFEPGEVPDGWQIRGVRPMAGLHGAESADVALCFRVADVDAAVQRVRELGGTAEEPVRRPYGRLATCTDDQGRTFYLNG